MSELSDLTSKLEDVRLEVAALEDVVPTLMEIQEEIRLLSIVMIWHGLGIDTSNKLPLAQILKELKALVKP